MGDLCNAEHGFMTFIRVKAGNVSRELSCCTYAQPEFRFTTAPSVRLGYKINAGHITQSVTLCDCTLNCRHDRDKPKCISASKCSVIASLASLHL